MKTELMSNKQFVMILERSGENLSVSRTNDDYVLEGIFAQFGVENNNHRIYEEKEYLPHLDYLKKKIEEKRLLGELDHPEKFDISLNKVSHLIEDIRYDSKKRQIVGKIKLLDTPSGQIAKNLVDSGVPISISSRAAGVVGENKKVQIKRIFTYDLVADPGFENAQMKRINESLGYNDDDTLAIYDMSDKTSKAFLESMDSEEINNPNTEKTPEKMQEFVTIDDMNKYSLIIKEEIERINGRLEKISESEDKEAKILALQEEVNNLKQYASYLAEEQNKALGYSNYLAEKVNQGIEYAEHVAEKADAGIAYAEHIAERTDKGIQYAESISEKLGQTIEFTNYLAEKQNQGLGYAEYLAEKLTKTIGYAEHIAEHADNSIRYSEYLAENSATKEDLKALTEYAEYIAEGINGGVKGRNNDLNEVEEEEEEKNKSEKGILNGAVTESRGIMSRYSNLNEKIKNVLESIEKQRMESTSLDKTYPFVKFLSEEKVNAFSALSEADKMRVTNAWNAKPAYDEAGVCSVWENALAKTEVNEKWLSDIPAEFLPLWENASAETKDRIIRQSKVYRLETDYQVKNFWQTRGLGATFVPEVGVVNESATPENTIDEKTPVLGYNAAYIESVKQGLNRYNKR
jgi:hypothetical protein